MEEPQSLEEWADVGLGCNRLPWLQGQELRRLKECSESFKQPEPAHGKETGGYAAVAADGPTARSVGV